MDGIFGGATIPLTRGTRDFKNSESDFQQLSRYAVVDRFTIDLDRGLILLGPLAREIHGLASDTVGIKRFLECYRETDRQGLLCLIERLASEGWPFHYTARLAGSDGRFVHGFIGGTDMSDSIADEWCGVLIMSRNGLVPAAHRKEACRA